MFSPYLATVLKKSCVHKKCTFGHHSADSGNGPGLLAHTSPNMDPGQTGLHALLQKVIPVHVNKNVFASAKVVPLATTKDALKIRTLKRYEINKFDFELICTLLDAL